MLKQAMLSLLIGLVAQTSAAETRDPTMPGNLPPITGIADGIDSPIQMNVTAIRISADSRIAIINGATVKRGEQLGDDVRILKIMPHYVLVDYHGDRKKLYLVPSIKQQ